jgi:hypothetical protein
VRSSTERNCPGFITTSSPGPAQTTWKLISFLRRKDGVIIRSRWRTYWLYRERREPASLAARRSKAEVDAGSITPGPVFLMEGGARARRPDMVVWLVRGLQALSRPEFVQRGACKQRGSRVVAGRAAPVVASGIPHAVEERFEGERRVGRPSSSSSIEVSLRRAAGISRCMRYTTAVAVATQRTHS